MIDSNKAIVIALRKQLANAEVHLAEQEAAVWVAISVMDDNTPGGLCRMPVRPLHALVPIKIVDPEDEDDQVVIRVREIDGYFTHALVKYYEKIGNSIEISSGTLSFENWDTFGLYNFRLARSREEAEALVAHLPMQVEESVCGTVIEGDLDALRGCDSFCEGSHCTSCHRPPQAEEPDMDAVVDTLMTELTSFDDGGCSCMVNHD